MNKQEAFDIIVPKLYEQGEASKDGITCKYRNSFGYKCAIGHLIPDEFYSPEFENKTASVVLGFLVNTDCKVFTEEDREAGFWNEIQRELHDGLPTFNSKEEWRKHFIAVAETYAARNNLKWSFDV